MVHATLHIYFPAKSHPGDKGDGACNMWGDTERNGVFLALRRLKGDELLSWTTWWIRTEKMKVDASWMCSDSTRGNECKLQTLLDLPSYSFTLSWENRCKPWILRVAKTSYPLDPLLKQIGVVPVLLCFITYMVNVIGGLLKDELIINVGKKLCLISIKLVRVYWWMRGSSEMEFSREWHVLGQEEDDNNKLMALIFFQLYFECIERIPRIVIVSQWWKLFLL